jgi:hypothetical protein
MKRSLVDGVLSAPPINSLRRIDGVPLLGLLDLPSLPSLGLVLDYTQSTYASGALANAVADGPDAVGYSGRYAELNGSSDTVNFGEISALNIAGKSVTFTWMWKPSASASGTEFFFSKGGNTAGYGAFRGESNSVSALSKNGTSNYHVVTADGVEANGVWNIGQVTYANGEITAYTVNGTSGFTESAPASGTYVDSVQGFTIGCRRRESDALAMNFYDGGIADVHAIEGGTTIFRAQLNEYSTGSLDGYAALDSSGNGNHGAYNGCEVGGVTEGPDISALIYEDYPTSVFFDGVNDYARKAVTEFRASDSSGAVEVQFATTAETGVFFGVNDEVADFNNFNVRMIDGQLGISTRTASGQPTNYVRTVDTFNDGELHTFRAESNGSSYTLLVDGVAVSTEVGGGSNNGDWFADIGNTQNVTIGVMKRSSESNFFEGIIRDVKVYDSTDTLVNHWKMYGGDPYDDQVGEDDLTANGSPIKVADKLRGREVPQTCFADWNKEVRISTAFKNSRLGFAYDTFLNASGRGFTATASSTSVATLALPFTAQVGDILRVRCVVLAGSPSVQLRISDLNYGSRSNSEALSVGENTVILTATGASAHLSITEGDATNVSIASLSIEVMQGSGTNSILIPASSADPTKDALGNDIDNPRGAYINPAGSGEKVVVPYHSSLNVTTTFELFFAGNFYIPAGSTQYRVLFDRLDWNNSKRSIMLYRDTNDSAEAGKLRFILDGDGSSPSDYYGVWYALDERPLYRFQFDGSGPTFKIWKYINGAWSAVTVYDAGSVGMPTSIYTSDIPFLIGGSFTDDADPNEAWDKPISPPAIYNRVLTDEEADVVRQVFEAKYGEF